MLEIPESRTIGLQAGETLTGRKIIEVFNATSPHKFAFFYGDPAGYAEILKGRKVKSAKGHGMFVDICCDENTFITIGEGTNMRYYLPSEQPPDRYQLLIVFDDGSFVAFNEVFFDNILQSTSKDLSAKALLATEQRIPGIGNGVLQDILFNAGIHPKRKKSALSDFEKARLFQSLKITLKNMTDLGGRDTERDFFWNTGGYKTILSKNTVKHPCPNCGDLIRKEAYLGGAVYYCPTCQKL